MRISKKLGFESLLFANVEIPDVFPCIAVQDGSMNELVVLYFCTPDANDDEIGLSKKVANIKRMNVVFRNII